jgi:hypothetical protein
VDDEVKVALEREDDPLAHSSEPDYPSAHDVGDRWIGGAKHKDVADLDAVDDLIDDPGRQAVDVDGDVRELGHGTTDVGHCGMLNAEKIRGGAGPYSAFLVR